ncbi:MAG: SPOR domain-containing protein [Bdellovibrionales bacterium]|nr:SPOR domain-containing protein [Bdellovibrionales bacterium]
MKKSWEMKLGPAHAAVLLGVVMGCMVCAFYLGLASGQRSGFESAQAGSFAQAAKLPVPLDLKSFDENPLETSDIYAKLSAPVDIDSNPTKGTGSQSDTLPELATIKTLSDAPLPTDLDDGSSDVAEVDEDSGGSAVDLSESDSQISAVRILGEAKNLNEKKGLTVAKNETVPLKDLIEAEKSDLTLGASQDALSEDSRALLKSPPAIRDEDKIAMLKESSKSVAATEQKEVLENVGSEAVLDTPPVLALSTSSKSDIELEASKENEGNSDFFQAVLAPGWYVQVAAPRQAQDAESLSKKLKSSGFPVVIERANVRGQEYFRVLSGPERSRSQAELLIGQLKRERYLRSDPFLRMIR